MVIVPLLTCLILSAVDESTPTPTPLSRDPFVQALTPPAATAVNAQVVRTVAAVERITGASAEEKSQVSQQPISTPTTAAPQPITLILRGTAPDPKGTWVALIEDPTIKQTLVVKVGQSINHTGQVAQVTRIEHAMLLLQVDGESLVLRQ